MKTEKKIATNYFVDKLNSIFLQDDKKKNIIELTWNDIFNINDYENYGRNFEINTEGRLDITMPSTQRKDDEIIIKENKTGKICSVNQEFLLDLVSRVCYSQQSMVLTDNNTKLIDWKGHLDFVNKTTEIIDIVDVDEENIDWHSMTVQVDLCYVIFTERYNDQNMYQQGHNEVHIEKLRYNISTGLPVNPMVNQEEYRIINVAEAKK